MVFILAMLRLQMDIVYLYVVDSICRMWTSHYGARLKHKHYLVRLVWLYIELALNINVF